MLTLIYTLSIDASLQGLVKLERGGHRRRLGEAIAYGLRGAIGEASGNDDCSFAIHQGLGLPKLHPRLAMVSAMCARAMCARVVRVWSV